MAHRVGCGVLNESLAQRVLVDAPEPRDADLVSPVDGGEKARLPQHPLCATIEIGVAGEAVGEELLESRDALPLPAQLVVEPHDLGDQPRPQVKRRRGARGDRLAGRGVNHHLALEGGQPARRRRQAGAQPIVELLTRDDIGQDNRLRGGQRAVFNRAPHLARGAARRHHDQARPRRWPGAVDRQHHDGAPESVQIGHAHEPCPSRCDHLS